MPQWRDLQVLFSQALLSPHCHLDRSAKRVVERTLYSAIHPSQQALRTNRL